MPMLIYKPLPAAAPEFVEFWSLRYRYVKDHLYDDNIGQELTAQRILDLFEWKNGTPLSKKKQASVCRNFIEHISELRDLQPNQNPSDLLAHFPDGGAIWRIFLASSLAATGFSDL